MSTQPLPPVRLISLVALTMLAFAANSILCRLALKTTDIDAATFTTIRLTSGALVLMTILYIRGVSSAFCGSWSAAAALFIYAAAFSYAYIDLPAAVGALLLFGAVQVTMISVGLKTGERFSALQWAGFLLAVWGLVNLLLPGLSAPKPLAGGLMILAGCAWGTYSLFGRKLGNPSAGTACNFVLTLPFTAILSIATLSSARLDSAGGAYAMVSGALASGIGYSIWYAVLPSLSATVAATLQLSVPVIAAIGGVLFLGEDFTLRLALCSISILGGIGLVIAGKRVVCAP